MFRSRALPFDPRANKIASLQSLKFHHGGLYEDYVSALNRDIADTPIVRGKIPLLACDLLEHAYYIDYQNARKSYVENFLHFADFGFASDAYCWAKKQGLGSVKLYIGELHSAASSRCDCGCCG